MARSKWKGNYIAKEIFRSRSYSKQLRCRQSCIPSSFLGHYTYVYNGRNFRRVTITKEKVGFKLGEFAYTRNYNAKKKQKNKKC